MVRDREHGQSGCRLPLKHCAAQAIEAGGAEADAMYEELVSLMDRSAR
jgi:hypothetical protein